VRGFSQPKFTPADLALLGDPGAGAILKYNLAVLHWGRSAIVPSYDGAIDAVWGFQEHKHKAQEKVDAARRAARRAVELFNAADPAKGGWRTVGRRETHPGRRRADVQIRIAEKAERDALKDLEQWHKAVESWTEWAEKVWADKERDFMARWRAGEIGSSAVPNAGGGRYEHNLFWKADPPADGGRIPRVADHLPAEANIAIPAQPPAPPLADVVPDPVLPDAAPPAPELPIVTASKNGVREAARAVYQEHGALNLPNAEKLVRALLLTQRRRAGKNALRTVLKEAEFVEKRRPSGRSRKAKV
jgi:hypothetical protein